ncbi:glycoside hydrolase TIM-barrel-like domain-containing protein [Gaetbulibacter aquiaggeris]|uniref:Glycoside hydrolase TIM-barrel-like domain-containing protein n=1 Tax=Gaetbulibacter aquiaggeris TaxID=1735373 RepID=A0ABW7MLZ9_9FLAO
MRLIYAFCLLFLLGSCAMTSINPTKINGVSFVASRDSISKKNIDPILKIHANYASVMPFGFIKNLSHPEIQYNSNRQWFGETKTGVKQYILELKEEGVHVMMKPQIWVWRGEFTGQISMTTEEDWKFLEDSYTKFIMDYAKLAEETDVEIFCIGTELENFIDKRPNYWKKLISQVKQVYHGKLTYAANWNEYLKTPFWSNLDYIGIDGYFPISDLKTPSVEDCKTGLQPWKNEMKAFYSKLKKPVLFTEFGYRSVDFNAKQPWRSDGYLDEVNLKAQTNATKAFFDAFWNENWVAGGFIWKWFHNHDKSGGKEDNQFTPQNKPVEFIIKEIYSNN